jgi:hypothetical protein
MPVLDKCYAVMEAVTALVRDATPGGDVRFNPPKAFRLSPYGSVAVFPGEAEEMPDSPLSSTLLQHSLPLFVGGAETPEATTAEAARAVTAAIEAAVSANRTLGGLVDWLRVSPEFSGLTSVEALGAEAADWASLNLIAEYSVGR